MVYTYGVLIQLNKEVSMIKNLSFKNVIASYEQLELHNIDTLSLLKDKLVAGCIESLKPIKPDEDKHADFYLSQAIATFQGLKASEFLRILEDFTLNIAPLYFEEHLTEEYIDQKVAEFDLRFEKVFKKLKISHNFDETTVSGMAWHSFAALAKYLNGSLYEIIEHTHAAQKIMLVSQSAKEALEANALNANKARHKRSQRAKELAIEFWQAENYRSKAEAARKIRLKIVAQLEKEGFKSMLKTPRAEQTIVGYFREWEKTNKHK
jgi:hypothetical protein